MHDLRASTRRRAPKSPTIFHFCALSIQGRTCSICCTSINLALVSAHSAPALHRGRSMPPESRVPHVAPFPPPVGLRSLDLRRAYLAAISSTRNDPGPHGGIPGKASPKSLEGLLQRASELLTRMSAQDPRSRLLQTALLRRDHALLAAVVRSFGDAPVPTRRKALWSPSRPAPRHAMLRTSERPTCRPPRRLAAE